MPRHRQAYDAALVAASEAEGITVDDLQWLLMEALIGEMDQPIARRQST
jgi:hypothetical protein